jgi:hypothetical protein
MGVSIPFDGGTPTHGLRPINTYTRQHPENVKSIVSLAPVFPPYGRKARREFRRVLKGAWIKAGARGLQTCWRGKSSFLIKAMEVDMRILIANLLRPSAWDLVVTSLL